jgi:uncharacterized membrane protein YkvI
MNSAAPVAAVGFTRIWRVYLVPAGVFQSLMIGGGYGTGREIVEYFSRFGFIGGLLGLALTAGCFALLLVVSFELAHRYCAYDYRSFFRVLLGRGWIVFELLYVTMFALVVAVVAAASADLVHQYLHLPGMVGVATLLLLVIVFAFYGREWVTGVLAYKALVLSAVFLFYFAIVFSRSSGRIAAQWHSHEIVSGWAMAAVRYCLYSSVVIPAMLFATRTIKTRTEAAVAGVSSAALGLVPAALLHISFGAGYPQIKAQAIPLYWMISSLKLPLLTAAYLVILFGSLFDVGIGFIQSINERIDGWSMERRGEHVSRPVRAGIALSCLLMSGALAQLGIVRLIAEGYGTLAYGFLILFVIPLLTVGMYRIIRPAIP